jgi:predicted nuclease of predicted toxin-antitoxin system
MTCARTLALG